MKKRILSLLLVLMMIVSLVPTAAMAYSDTDVAYAVTGGNIYFNESTGTITDCDTSVTEAIIPSEINGVAVTSIGDDAFYLCRSLTSITITDGVTSIGSGNFISCPSLENISVAINNSAYNSIDGVLFDKAQSTLIRYPQGKDSISYAIPSSVTNIGDKAFLSCGSLTTIILPDGVASIGDSAFSWCSGLTSVAIPNSVTSIGDHAFYRCSSLASITLPNSVTSIGDDAFYGCSSLATITIPNSVTSIGDSAFSWCSGLTSVAIPNSVTSIGDHAFYRCDGLATVTISNGVSSIGDYAFMYCSGLASITLPNSVTSIGDGAFYGCSSLASINVAADNSSYSSIDGVLFDKAQSTLITYPLGKSADSYTVPNDVTAIGDSAFDECSLKAITLPDSVTNIGDYAFKGCNSMTTITIPNSVTSIGDSAFSWCNSLTDVYYAGSESEWNEITIQPYNETLTNATIHFHTHSYTSTVTAPTCTEKGYTTYTCTSCGNSYVDNYTNALGHSYTSGKCTRCGAADPNYKAPAAVTFSDVAAKAYYANAVQWAVENKITNGTDATHFSPDQGCTRGQVVTFLWRAAGSPKVSGDAGFVDVKASDYFYDAVKWAVANGITNGTDATHFSPSATCTRAQVVTFMYRAEGSPATSGSCAFVDVSSTAYYHDAVIWAVANNITNGTDATHFSPSATCTRAQVVTFLYRNAEK